ncbi:MAG: hypothetical protein F4Y16_01045 [Holophagales bacterium]|nr:hypothetical protein [Holophagales bacterium]MYH26168.1 hypothetical protein [Holophagales bacterium]
MEHDEMNDDTSSSAGSDAESSTSAGPPEPPEPPEPPAEDAGPGLAGQIAAGLALIVLGGVLLFLERLDSGAHGYLLFILIGGVFVAGYLYKRAFGLLIPGALLLGIGGGLVFEDLHSGPFVDGDNVALGLGLGFILIYVASLLYERQNRWWPLIPGGFLVIASLPEFVWVEDVLDFWPVGVMAVGVLLLFRGVASRQREGEARRVDP